LTRNVPSDSISGTTKWPVFEAAVRAAALWFSYGQDSQMLNARELAVMAFGDEKGWTHERMTAFANLIGRPFDHAVAVTDATLRIRGPVQLRVGAVVADALIANPWITVPSAAREETILVDCGVKGVLIVENPEAFAMVCQISEVTDRWLCLQAPLAIWRIADAIATLRRVPIAAWCDGDIAGIRIIGQLQRTLGVTVHPIGMTVELFKFSSPTPGQHRAEPCDLAAQTPDVLHPLLELIKINGGRGYEQEAVALQILPTLEAQLRSLEWT
jgi:hypothetical protein